MKRGDTITTVHYRQRLRKTQHETVVTSCDHKQVPDPEAEQVHTGTTGLQANRQHATRAPSQPRTPRLSPGSAEKEVRLRLLHLRSLGRLLVPSGRVGRADHLGCHGTRYVRHGTPEAGTRTQYVQCVMPGGRPPCASGTCPTREAGTRSPCERYGGAGACVSAEPTTLARGSP